MIGVVATLDGLASVGERRVQWRRIDWAAACWAVLAKLWFFTGPSLGRLALVPENRSALELVRPGDAVATTSYLAPQLSGRRMVLLPAAVDDDLETLERQRGINCCSFIHRYRAGPPRASCSAACWSRPAAGAGAAGSGRGVCSCTAARPKGPRRDGTQKPRLPAPL